MQRQSHAKRGAFAHDAFYFNTAMMTTDDFPGD
jgi:hypothetical protein